MTGSSATTQSRDAKATLAFDPVREADALQALAAAHPCSDHPLFQWLQEHDLTKAQAIALLFNYDAHATVLRRLLLKAATMMPEKAVGYVIENVRTEYGSGKVEGRHQLQLKDLAYACGAQEADFARGGIAQGVRQYIRQILPFYMPSMAKKSDKLNRSYKPAIIAGAITATEIMSVLEFRYMQRAFRSLALADHIWFDHVKWEAEHTEESLALSLYFIEHHDAVASVEFGLNAVLDATSHLYDGFLESIKAVR